MNSDIVDNADLMNNVAYEMNSEGEPNCCLTSSRIEEGEHSNLMILRCGGRPASIKGMD